MNRVADHPASSADRGVPLEQCLCCPSCHGTLGESACDECGRKFHRVGERWEFLHTISESADSNFQSETNQRTSLRAKLFVAGRRLLSSEFQPRNHLKALLASIPGGAVVVDMGSGARRLGPFINVDLFPFPNVDVVADVAQTPIRNELADIVILDSVVEHVPEPRLVISEARRILKPDGLIFINCPFMIPYHGYPKHYQNFTRDGLEHLLADFRDLVISPTFGPMTAWVNMTAETFAVIIGGERGLPYVIAKGAALAPIFWLKYFDALFVRLRRTHRISGMLCAVARK